MQLKSWVSFSECWRVHPLDVTYEDIFETTSCWQVLMSPEEPLNTPGHKPIDGDPRQQVHVESHEVGPCSEHLGLSRHCTHTVGTVNGLASVPSAELTCKRSTSELASELGTVARWMLLRRANGQRAPALYMNKATARTHTQNVAPWGFTSDRQVG